jgi:hypothetical protein
MAAFKLRDFQKVIGKVFGPMREEVMKDWKELHH